MMKINEELLERFESGLDPQNLKNSLVPAVILGYGEISTVFQIGGCLDTAYKRMPLFKDIASAERYSRQFIEYCSLLSESGLMLPESRTGIVSLPGRPVVLYIAQKILPPERFAHKLIHLQSPEKSLEMIEKILLQVELVGSFNRNRGPLLELAVDGQLSNWVVSEKNTDEIYFVDTSTPLYRKNGVEQLDPELLLQSAPGFLRWILRLFFLKDVMNRYYDMRQVCVDIAANLFKEQKAEMVPMAVETMNGIFFGKENPVTAEEVKKYYGTDRIIWALFLAFRRFDRFITARIMRKRYEFILPGKIKR
jgi:hypothetical protein